MHQRVPIKGGEVGNRKTTHRAQSRSREKFVFGVLAGGWEKKGETGGTKAQGQLAGKKGLQERTEGKADRKRSKLDRGTLETLNQMGEADQELTHR